MPRHENLLLEVLHGNTSNGVLPISRSGPVPCPASPSRVLTPARTPDFLFPVEMRGNLGNLALVMILGHTTN